MRIRYILFLIIFLPFWLLAIPDTLYLDNTAQTLEKGALYLGTPNQSVANISLIDFQQVDFQNISADTTTDFYLHWVVKNTTNWDNTWIIQYEDYWHLVALYTKKSGNWQLTNKSGIFVPMSERLHFERTKIYLPIAIKSGATKEILIRLAYDHANNCYNPSGHLEEGTIDLQKNIKARDRQVRQVINVFSGAFLIMFLYNFLLFFHTRDKNYLLYLLIIIGASIAQEINFHFLGAHFENQFTYYKIPPLVSVIFHTAIVLFTRSFLQVKQHFPFWNKVLSGLIVLFCLTPIPVLFGYIKPSFLLIGISRISLIITVLVIGFKSYRKQIPGSLFYILGQIFFFLSFLIAPVILFGIIPYTEWLLYLPNLGITSLIIFLSVALGDRITALRKENEEKQLQIIQSERKNTLLERERVEELKDINASITRFVPYEFINALQKEKITDVKLGDHVERTVSVLFSDIRSYTTLSESMTPEENFKFVVDYSKRMGPIIDQNKGFITQYLGDGIMSLFLHRADDAVQAAIDMQLSIQIYNNELSKNQAPLQVGIGLETGSLIMGIIGHSNRTDPATISDTVNTSARLEGLTKFFGVLLIVGENAFKNLENPAAFNHRYLGKVLLKGKNVPRNIYDFFDGDTPATKQLKLRTKADFDQAIQAYFTKDIAQAKVLFEKVLQIHPTDQAAIHYFNKCQLLLQKVLPTDWSPVEIMLEK